MKAQNDMILQLWLLRVSIPRRLDKKDANRHIYQKRRQFGLFQFHIDAIKMVLVRRRKARIQYISITRSIAAYFLAIGLR